MKELYKNIESGIECFDWKTDSPLKKVNQETECKLIFDSVCEEIGKYYSMFGFKVSKRKIQLNLDEFILKIQFSSSAYNQKGDFIWLEINSGVYPKELSKKYKEEKEVLLPIVFANTNLLDKKITTEIESNFLTRGINILGKENIVESKFDESTVEYSRGLNLYSINLEEFKMILKYINRLIRKSIEIVTDKDHLMEYLRNPTQRQLYWIIEKRIEDFMNLYYPNDKEVIDRLNELKMKKENPV